MEPVAAGAESALRKARRHRNWTLAGQAGHASPHMTLGTYAHFQPAQDRDAAELLATLCDNDPTEAAR